MAIRNCAEIGRILRECLKRLQKNTRLLQLLYNTDVNPFKDFSNSLDPDIKHKLINGSELDVDIWKNKIYNKLIKVTPKFDPQETSVSCISLEVVQGVRNSNDEFRDILIAIHVIVPLTQWMIIDKDDSNLRPFAIMGELQKSLDGKKLGDSIGNMNGGDFEVNFLTDEVACYVQKFWVTTYD